MLQVYTPTMTALYLEDKKTVHQKGLWHKVFTGILYNKAKRKIYFQTIFPKESYTFERPDYIDFSVGGHVEEKENILNAAFRETKEELGLNINKDNLHFLGIRVCNCDPAPTYKIREFQYFYAIELPGELENIDFEAMDCEVKSIVEVDIDDYLKLLTQEKDSVLCHEFLLNREEKSFKIMTDVELTTGRIIPDYLSDKSILEKILALKALLD